MKNFGTTIGARIGQFMLFEVESFSITFCFFLIHFHDGQIHSMFKNHVKRSLVYVYY